MARPWRSPSISRYHSVPATGTSIDSAAARARVGGSRGLLSLRRGGRRCGRCGVGRARGFCMAASWHCPTKPDVPVEASYDAKECNAVEEGGGEGHGAVDHLRQSGRGGWEAPPATALRGSCRWVGA